jgi:hypothetical protein
MNWRYFWTVTVFENVTENLHSVQQGKILFDQLSNYRFLLYAKFSLWTDSFIMECCERLLHQNKVVAFSAHQITCLLSVMGLNYRGRWCQMVSCTLKPHGAGQSPPQSLCLCITWYRLLLLLLQLQVSVSSHEALRVSTGSSASW